MKQRRRRGDVASTTGEAFLELTVKAIIPLPEGVRHRLRLRSELPQGGGRALRALRAEDGQRHTASHHAGRVPTKFLRLDKKNRSPILFNS